MGLAGQRADSSSSDTHGSGAFQKGQTNSSLSAREGTQGAETLPALGMIILKLSAI